MDPFLRLFLLRITLGLFEGNFRALRAQSAPLLERAYRKKVLDISDLDMLSRFLILMSCSERSELYQAIDSDPRTKRFSPAELYSDLRETTTIRMQDLLLHAHFNLREPGARALMRLVSGLPMWKSLTLFLARRGLVEEEYARHRACDLVCRFLDGLDYDDLTSDSDPIVLLYQHARKAGGWPNPSEWRKPLPLWVETISEHERKFLELAHQSDPGERELVYLWLYAGLSSHQLAQLLAKNDLTRETEEISSFLGEWCLGFLDSL